MQICDRFLNQVLKMSFFLNFNDTYDITTIKILKKYFYPQKINNLQKNNIVCQKIVTEQLQNPVTHTMQFFSSFDHNGGYV